MAGSLLPLAKQIIQTDAWGPGIGYKIYTYESGTLTAKATYTDAALTSANTNPVIANARGEVVMYGTGRYRVIVKDASDVTVYDRDDVDANASAVDLSAPDGVLLVGNAADKRDLASASGAGLVGHVGLGTGAVATTVESVLRESVSVFRFMTAAQIADVRDGTALLDVTAPIQAALDYARTLVLQTATSITDANFPIKGGVTVYAPQGKYKITQIEVPETVGLSGAGKTSTLFVSEYDGAIIRNKVTAGDGTYDKAGIQLSNFAVQGDRTKTNQTGIDTLRLFDAKIENINIGGCGLHGLRVRQALVSKIANVSCLNNVGAGIVLDEGIVSWADTTPSGLPANINTIENCHGFFNDAAGLLIQGLANGNIVLGGSYESNYLSGGNNIGYNIEVTSTTFSRNLIDGAWTEGAVKAHIYINHATTGSSTDVHNWKHFGNGADGNVDRALICDKGSVAIRNAFGHGSSYKSIAGSIKPFRVDVAGADSSVNVIDCDGATITDGIFLEDGAGAAVTSMYQKSSNRFITGINFDNTQASSNANVLDEYQEGTWTPTLTTDGVNFDAVTYNALRGGRYTKIGNVVHIQGVVRTDAVTDTSASGSVSIGGLPFTSSANTGSPETGTSAVTIGHAAAWVTNHPVSGYILAGTTRITLVTRATSNGATSTMAKTDVAAGANSNLVRFSATYIASA